MRNFRKKGWKLPRFCRYLLGNSAWSPICCWPHFPVLIGHFLVAFQHTQNCQKLFNKAFRYFPAAFPHLLSNAQQLPNDLKGIVISCRKNVVISVYFLDRACLQFLYIKIEGAQDHFFKLSGSYPSYTPTSRLYLM